MRYEWVEDWPALPSGALMDGWAHTGVAVTAEGHIVVGAPGETTLLFFDRGGALVDRVQLDGIAETHALAFVDDGVWIADTGSKDRIVGSEPDLDAAARGWGSSCSTS